MEGRAILKGSAVEELLSRFRQQSLRPSRLESHFSRHSFRATVREYTELVRALKQEFWWRHLIPRIWISTMTPLGKLATRRTEKDFPYHAQVSIVSLVHEPSATRRFRPISADLTDRLENWIRENTHANSLVYRDTLRGLKVAEVPTLIIANYDWLVRMPPKGRLVRILREALLARRLNARIIAAPVDLWSLRLSLHASVLIAAAGGWTLVCQNSVRHAQRFLLPNPVAALWMWPKREVRKWITEKESAKPGGLALLAASGDPVRKRYFVQLRNQLEDNGFETVDTQKNLPWDDYFSLVRSAKLVATTCWIQPIFHVGPERFRRLIADGHITMRVWEGFAVGATVLVPEVSALREIGFEANKHYLNLPPAGEWDTWVLPPEESLTAIGLAGHRRFLELAGL